MFVSYSCIEIRIVMNSLRVLLHVLKTNACLYYTCKIKFIFFYMEKCIHLKKLCLFGSNK